MYDPSAYNRGTIAIPGFKPLMVANGYASRIELDQTVAAGVKVLIGLRTGTYGAIVSDRAFTASVDSRFRLYRGTVWSGGTQLVQGNRNDLFWGEANRAPFDSAAHGVAAPTSAANLMGTVRLIAAGSGSARAGVASDASDIYLAPSSSYVVELENTSAQSGELSFSLVAILLRMSGN